MSAADHLNSKQFQIPNHLARPAAEYPTKGWRKDPDRLTAQQRMMGASRGYDSYLDAARKGVSPNLN